MPPAKAGGTEPRSAPVRGFAAGKVEQSQFCNESLIFNSQHLPQSCEQRGARREFVHGCSPPWPGGIPSKPSKASWTIRSIEVTSSLRSFLNSPWRRFLDRVPPF